MVKGEPSMPWAARIACAAAFAVIGNIPPAWAFEPRSGTFVAERECVATTRIRDRAGVGIKAGTSYPLLGANRAEARHYQIRLPGGGGDRWIAASCGRTLAQDGAGDDGGSVDPGRP